MNERIRELAEHAGAVFEPTNGLNDCPQDSLVDDEIEKFAELIVLECADIIESQDVDPSFRLRMSWAVKKHFGVK